MEFISEFKGLTFFRDRSRVPEWSVCDVPR